MSAHVPSLIPVRSGRKRPGRRRIRLPIVPARGGDHSAVYYFLTALFQGPSRAEFRASLEDPFYEPNDRLLVKSDGHIIAHGHIIHRVMQFGSAQIPVAGLEWMGTLPEHRGRGHGRRLLCAAEKQMSQSGALVGLLRSSTPRFFRHNGWAVSGQHDYSRADARAVVARLLDKGLRTRRRRRLQIRPWRRWEEGALMRIYDQHIEGTHGPLRRSEAYWQWLVRRQAFDQIYVALDGPDLLDLEEISTRIVGYAVTKGERIVELLNAAGRPSASAELLARICGDAIEHDRQSVVMHAPSDHVLHKVLRKAGGTGHHHESDGDAVYMARLLRPLRLLKMLQGEFHRRAEEAGLARPLELGLLVDGKRLSIEVNRQGTRALSRRLGHDHLQLDASDFTRMVLGQLDWPRALAEQRVIASSPLAQQAGLALFPRLPLWRPPLDEMPA